MFFCRVFVWVLLMFHPTSTLNRKDHMLYFHRCLWDEMLDKGFRSRGKFLDFYSRVFHSQTIGGDTSNETVVKNWAGQARWYLL